MQRILLVITISLGILFGLNAQIVFLNSSFENGHYDCSNTNIQQWNTCELGVFNCIIDTIPEARPDSAIDGRFVGEVSGSNNDYGSFSQHTSCGFKKGVEYTFSVYLAAYIPTNNPTVFPKFSRGKIEIWLGNDTCQWQQMIFISPLLDSVWENFNIVFTPDTVYNYFFFRGHPPTTSPVLSTLMIDALSPIAIVNSNQIHTYQQDTLLPIGSSLCVNVNAYGDAGYDSVWWEQQGVGVISTQINAGVHCVDSNTTFIVHIMGSDSTCAGYLPSSDTIRVQFYDPNAINEIAKSIIEVYPNPATENINFKIYLSPEQTGAEVKIYNAQGALVHSFTANDSWSSYQWDVKDASNGLYCYTVTGNQTILAKSKLIVQH